MKENLKVKINSVEEREEAQNLFHSMGSRIFRGSQFEVVVVYELMKPFKEITLPELRELARPKEYLNDKFELVVTNQPLDGWILVPDGAECYAFQRNEHEAPFFYKKISVGLSFYACDKSWINSSSKHFGNLEETLWQRENKVETAKGREGNAGRFLHQWAYEAFGRGEDVQHDLNELNDWQELKASYGMSIFDSPDHRFRLKPQTIQIGSRTINKPISVKPERGTTIYIAMLTDNDKYDEIAWNDYPEDNLYLSRNLCHLTAADAIAMTDALLELMK